MQRIQYVKIVPARHTADFMTRRRVGVKGSAANEGRSTRILQWLVAGLAFLALFLVSLRALGWV